MHFLARLAPVAALLVPVAALAFDPGKATSSDRSVTAPSLQLGGPITCTAASCLAPGLSTQMPSASTPLLIERHLSLLPIPVEAYGAKGDGVANDAPAINAAIQAACAKGGGRVILMRRHALGAPVDNNCNGVLVVGVGGPETEHDVGSGTAGTLVVPKARYVGTGLRHRTRPASELGISAGTNRAISGGGFENITVQGFRRNLHVTSTRRGTYRLTLYDATGTESALFDTLPDFNRGALAQVGEAGDTQQMTFDINFRQYADVTTGTTTSQADGVVFAGAGPNISYNGGMRLSGRIQDGVGLRIINGDNNDFSEFRIGVFGSGKPLLIYPNAPGISTNDSNSFDHYFSNVPGYIQGAADRPDLPGAYAPIQTTINFPDLSNSSALPIAGAGVSLTVINGGKQWLNWTPTFSAPSGAFANTILAYARYNRDPLSNTVRFSLVFRIDYTAQPTGLRFTLPFASRDGGTFAAYGGSTGRILVSTVDANSNLATIHRDGGKSPLEGSGNFYSVSGTYETP